MSSRGEFKLPHSVEQGIISRLERANPYKTKVQSYSGHRQPLERYPWSATLTGLIDKVELKTITPAIMLKKISHVDSGLRNDKRVFVQSVRFDMNAISTNAKLLTFDQIRTLMAAKYGEPTRRGRTIYVKNWKTNKDDVRNELIWENKHVMLTLTGRRVSQEEVEDSAPYLDDWDEDCDQDIHGTTHGFHFDYSKRYRKDGLSWNDCSTWPGWRYIDSGKAVIEDGAFVESVDAEHMAQAFFGETSDYLTISLVNKSVSDQLYDQAYKIFEAEEFVLLKQRIEKMAQTERDKLKSATELSF